MKQIDSFIKDQIREKFIFYRGKKASNQNNSLNTCSTQRSKDRSILTTNYTIQHKFQILDYSSNDEYKSARLGNSRHLRVKTDASFDINNNQTYTSLRKSDYGSPKELTVITSPKIPSLFLLDQSLNTVDSFSLKSKTYNQHQRTISTFMQAKQSLNKSEMLQKSPPKVLREPTDKGHKNYRIGFHVSQNELLILEAILNKNIFGMINLMTKPLELCQDCQELKGFGKIIRFLGRFALYCEKANLATFLFSQALIVAEATRNHTLKIQTLLGLSACARKIKEYDMGIKILRKALVYSWKMGSIKKELLIYDLLGISYFYQGDVEKAQLYHDRFVIGNVEPDNSYLRQTSDKYVKYFEQKQSYYTKKFTKVLMIQLCLPIKNRFSQLSDLSTGDQERCDLLRHVNMQNCDGLTILQNLCNSYEFVHLALENFNLEQPLQNENLEKDVKRFKLRDRIISTPKCYSIKRKVNNINNDKLCNIKNSNLGENHLIFKDYESAMMRVKQHVAGTIDPYSLFQDQVFMSHLKENDKDKPQIQKNSQVKFKKFFVRLLEYLMST